MVFRKYRAVKQWGKMDTRIFKEIYNSRNKRKMPAFQVPEAIEALGVKIFEANDPMIFARQQQRNIIETAANDYNQRIVQNEQQHPLFKSNKAYIFEGEEPMSDGIAQASLLTKSIVRNGLPESIIHSSSKIEIDEETVCDAILHGERYDPTLEKLPKRFDPVLFWVKHIRVHGTPVVKRNNIILDNLLRQVVFAGLRTNTLKTNMQINRDSPLSVHLSGGLYFYDNPLVLRGQPHLTVQSSDSNITSAWAGKSDIDAANQEPLPDIYPISPIIDFNKDNIYNDDLLLTRKTHQSHIHSVLWSREQDQKYAWTKEQNMANAILTTYAAAVAEATRNGQTELEKPLLVRGVQLVDGRLDLVAFQLNTLELTEEENPVKNIVWIEKGIELYKPKPFYEQMEQVEKLNMETFKKFVALMLGHIH